MQFLSSYNNDVGEIEQAVASLQEKDQKIRSLTMTIMELKRSNNEEIQGLKAEAVEAATRWAELEHQKARFKEGQEALKKQIEQEKVKQTSFIQQQERKFEKKLEEERDKLVKANASQFERLKRENTKLNEKIGTLTEEKVQIEKTLKLYVQNSNALESQVDELKLRYPTQSLPIEHYEEKLSRIRQKIQAIAQHFLSNLPPDNEFNIEETQKEFHHMNSILGTISLSASVTSKFLRVRGAQCTIVHAIHKLFWQPFYITTQPLSHETTAILSQITHALAGEDRHTESLWRFLSFKGLETRTSQDIHVEETGIMGFLRRLIPAKEHRAFEDELREILQESIRFWNELKRDSCLVEFDLQPPAVCSPGWVAEDCPELEDVNVKSKEDSAHKPTIQQSWCLFPKIIFHPVDAKKIIVSGYAVFVDSRAFRENCDEIRRHEEEIAQVRMNLVRRPTLRAAAVSPST
ncbi:uncharacterized protein BHQ10_010338 [Talaromyces amestolkiae]|uniref:Uncharacterized protein n=1 Tax=Talaromyces amestolkiae TaxID=1196081 RepID=A0A364LET0_TALAM|nr:uncharacterized protein BHQ10_010338 [Talaromyces amestolkiae]RAO74326.1 hypothetical protein BHQ10_010338 [Talaromyces amestolkiae]